MFLQCRGDRPMLNTGQPKREHDHHEKDRTRTRGDLKKKRCSASVVRHALRFDLEHDQQLAPRVQRAPDEKRTVRREHSLRLEQLPFVVIQMHVD